MKKAFQNLRKFETNSANYVNFDIASLLRNIAGAELWKQKKGLWAAISGACTQYSKQSYDKLTNLVKNTTDIDYCNIHALKSISKQVGAQHLTDFINEDYPKDLENLINLFSIPQHLILKGSGLLNKLALTDIVGTIDQRNKDIYLQKNGYSEILFHEILNKLDEIKYLLQTTNQINLNFSIWNYVNFKNRNVEYVSLSSLFESANGTDVQTYSAPSVNRIFEELYYLRDNFQDTYQNSLYDENTINKFKIGYQENYNDQYLGKSNFWNITKQFIINKCTKIVKYKDLNTFKNYTDCSGLNQISFGWTPYDLDVINNPEKFKFINDLSIDENVVLINPFLILIAIFKNVLFNSTTGKKLQLSYVDEKTQTTIDLSILILNCCQTIQNNPEAYYSEFLVYHFYGLFYDMIINDYLKNEWQIYLDDQKINQKFIGVYSQYSKEEFTNKLSKSVKSDSLVEFFENGPEYYNQYHVDFINYLNIVNNLLDTQDDQFSYIITNYNNDFSLDDTKNTIYNSEKRRLLGFKSSIKYIENIQNIQAQSTKLQLDIDSSVLYQIACKFADYCIKIRNTRQAIKGIIQEYARIGTSELIENVIKQYFYKNFSDKKEWSLYKDGKDLSYLSSYNLLNPLSSYTQFKNRFSIDLVEYYDTTNYLNIYAQKPKEVYGYTNGQTTTEVVECSGSTPSTYMVRYRLDKDVISSFTQKKFLKDTQLINTNSILDFDNVVLESDEDGNTINPCMEYIPTLAAVSTIVSSYVNNIYSSRFCYCNYYYTNGYNTSSLSGKWTLSELPASQFTQVVANYSVQESFQSTTIRQTKFQILNSNLFLSSLYETNSDEFKNLLQQNNIQYSEDIELSSIIAPKNTYIIPSGTLVEKSVTGIIDYTYNILSSVTEQIPLYKDAEITGTYNYRFWEIQNTDSDSLYDILSTQASYWDQYFPELQKAVNSQAKLKIYKNKIYPFLSSILDIHAVSGFSGDLSGLNKQYSGDKNIGDYVTNNISNTIFPTVAPVQNIANLVPLEEINTENNLYINLYLNTFYKDLQKYSQNVLQSLLECNQTYNNSSIGYPVSSWYSKYTTFNGYNSVYGQDNNLDQTTSESNKLINVDGPWIYSVLQFFIKLYYTSQVADREFQFNSLRGPLAFSNKINQNQDTYIPISLNFIMKQSNKIINTITYDNIFDFVENYYNFKTTSQITNMANILFLYQHKIINKQYYRVYDYKEDMYGNSFTLFKYYKFNKYEDTGQIWIRQKNTGLSIPVMFCREVDESENYEYDNQDILILKEHNKYASLLKQLFNNAIQFNIYNNSMWILGYSNYIKSGKNLVKQQNQYLKLCVFSYEYNSSLGKYVIDINSIKSISQNINNDFLNDINAFVGAYNNFNTKKIEFILNDFTQLNNEISTEYKYYQKLKKDQEFINNKINLNNISINFIKYDYNLDSYQLSDYTTITMEDAKYPIIGLFNQNQLINNTRFSTELCKNSNIIENYIGNTIQMYKFTDNSTTDLQPFQKIRSTTIEMNNQYNSIDILFNIISDDTDYQIHKNCKDYNRNIIGSFYNSETKSYQSLDFSGTINNPVSGYFAISGASDYLFRIIPYMKCECNQKDFQDEQVKYITEILNTQYKDEINFNKVSLKGYLRTPISNLSYTREFSSSLQVHAYFCLARIENAYNYHYHIYYIDDNNQVQDKDLGDIKEFHKLNCYYSNVFKQKNQHIWTTNLNNNQFYIAYESINPDILSSASYYKDLYYSQKQDLYIDTIIFEGTIIKKRIGQNNYSNIISDITLSYGTDKVELPFTFSELSSYIIPEGSYYYTDDSKNVDTIQLTGNLNPSWWNWCSMYGNEFNKIHQTYPKCQIEGNKLKCTTILTKLGGKKDFLQDISNNEKSIQFLAYYILNSTFRKKIANLDQNTWIKKGGDTYNVFQSLQTVSGYYCINDYLFAIKQLEYFKGSEYFDFNFEEGFNDIREILTKTTQYYKDKQENISINGKSVQKYLEETYTKNNPDETQIPSYERLIKMQDGYQIFNEGFKYNFYPFTQDSYQDYLTFMNAMPSFVSCFNDNLKIFINFGDISSQVSKFITGSQTFDLDISVYIDDSEYNGVEHLKKVGWHCGYTSTDYLNWKTKDNRFGGPELVEVNLQKYLSYLYNKYVTSQEYLKPKYNYNSFNTIAQNVKIHIDVCWHNESILISLNPSLEIYWKGMYHKVEVNGKQMSKNNKCCKDSWSYDLLVDLTNNVLKYDSTSNLYPVFATLLNINQYYKITSNNLDWSNNIIWNNKEFNKLDTKDLSSNYQFIKTNEVSYSNLKQNYQDYRLNLKDIFEYSVRTYIDLLLLKDGKSYTSILSGFIDSNYDLLLKTYTKNDIYNILLQEALNYNTQQKINYSQRQTTIKDCADLLIIYPLNTLSNGYRQNELIHTSFVNWINSFGENNQKQAIYQVILNVFLHNTLNIDTLTNVVKDYYSLMEQSIGSQNIFNQFSNTQSRTTTLTISAYHEYIPSTFTQYYTSIDDISGLLGKIGNNFYYQKMTLDLTSAFLMQSKVNQKAISYDQVPFIEKLDEGYIVIIEKDTQDKIRRSVIVTDLAKVMNTNGPISMKISNYQSIDNYVQEYLKQTLNIEIINQGTGNAEIYNFNNSLYTYTPEYDLLIEPLLKYYITNRKTDLYLKSLLPSYEETILRYKSFGYYFDAPLSYQNVTKNVLTNNFDITYNINMNGFFFNKEDNINLVNNNEFKIQSQELADKNMDVDTIYPKYSLLNKGIGYEYFMKKLNDISDDKSISIPTYNITSYVNQVPTSNISLEYSSDLDGILQLTIKPFYNQKYVRRYLTENKVIISNFKSLFTQTIPSSSIENKNQYQLINNEMYLVNSKFENQEIFEILNNYLTDKQTTNLYFVSNTLTYPLRLVHEFNGEIVIPVVTNEGLQNQTINEPIDFENTIQLELENYSTTTQKRIRHTGYILSGFGYNIDDFDYTISAYQTIKTTSYLVGLIHGNYRYKSIQIQNKIKDNKTNFIFTTNMSDKEINQELLSKNIVSSIVSIPTTQININGVNYTDLDFVSGQLENNISMILG